MSRSATDGEWNPFEGVTDYVAVEYRKFRMNVLRAALNSVLAVTPPNAPGTKKLTQSAVKKLRGRILRDIIGSENLKSPDLRTAVPNQDGKPILFRGGGGSVPFVVPRVKGRAARARLGMAKPEYLMEKFTRMGRRHGVYHRMMLPGAEYRWVTAKDWVAVAREYQLRAGALLEGWREADDAIGGGGLSKVLPKNACRKSRGASGWASEPEDTGHDVMSWEAANYAAKSSHVARYVQRHLEWRLNGEAVYYAKTFSRFYVAAVKKYLRKQRRAA